jgi:hypothetical protein
MKAQPRCVAAFQEFQAVSERANCVARGHWRVRHREVQGARHRVEVVVAHSPGGLVPCLYKLNYFGGLLPARSALMLPRLGVVLEYL